LPIVRLLASVRPYDQISTVRRSSIARWRASVCEVQSGRRYGLADGEAGDLAAVRSDEHGGSGRESQHGRRFRR
jgi:hypothetical protein